MTKELSFEDLLSMTEKQGIKLPFTSFEQAGEMLGISSGKANALTIITALVEKAAWEIPICRHCLTKYRKCREL